MLSTLYMGIPVVLMICCIFLFLLIILVDLGIMHDFYINRLTLLSIVKVVRLYIGFYSPRENVTTSVFDFGSMLILS